MTEFAEFMHYATIAFIVACNAIGVGIGQGLTSAHAISAINKQPSAREDITRAAVLAMALIETSAIMATFVSIMLLFGTQSAPRTEMLCLAQLGIAFAMCCTGCTIGFASCLPARAACSAIARQPFFAQRILQFLLIVLSLIQTPIIFGLIVALVIQGQLYEATTMRESIRLLSSGVCIGLGSIGPSIGLALFSRAACRGIGINRNAYANVLNFTFISVAMIETPIIFSLIISVILLFVVPHSQYENFMEAVIFFSAALCTGIGTIGSGLSSGRTAASACRQIAQQPSLHVILSRASMFALGLIETCAIYPVLVSLILLFYR